MPIDSGNVHFERKKRVISMLLKEIKEVYHRELDQNYSREEVDSMFYLMIEHFWD